ncbi:hypothetical protein F5887DRAFT_969248 [Amanita rubescens]|nr:hypothetical protein F5887DRAFT_969248 [Amanita rubescens]
MSSRAASSVKVTIPKSGYFVEKAGPHSQSFVNRRAIYFGVGFFPSGINVILGAITLGWLEGSFTDGHSMVLHVTAATILSFVVFMTLCILLWWSRDAPLPSRRPIGHLLQTLLLALIFGTIGSIITIDLPHSCHPGLVADRISLHLTSCALLATIASLSYLPMIPLFATIVIVCYHLVFPSPEKSGDSPAWGTWGSASAIEKGDVDSVLDGK